MIDEAKDYPPQIGGNHYDKYRIEPIAALKDWLTPDEFRGFLRGNAIKYQIRYRDKGGAEDLAIKQGCTCPVYDNARGKGIMGDGEKYGYWITAGCPLHGQRGQE